ncbi:MAG: glycosyltransferase family 9 protein [Chitinophagales bacterium]|nr:glycosyltransferase family 9 protein [Chitinophagales bacterium]
MKILILRFSSIGDIVLTTPVVRCLKMQLGAEIHFLTKKSFASILEANPYCDRVHTFDKDLSQALLAELVSERFDWVIDLHHNLRSMRLKWALRRPSRAFNKLNLEKWLLVNLGWNLMPEQHIVDRYLATVAHLGVQNDGEGLDYFIPQGTSLPTDALPAQPFVAFAIGATHATKRMPESGIIRICQQIRQPVVLLGGKQEEAEGTRIAAAAGVHVYNLCGRLSLHQSAMVAQRSEHVITHDTGLMHMAAALRKPITSIWGSTVPAFGMYPYYPTGLGLNTSCEVSGLSCRPCSKIGHAQCPKGHFKCMANQDIPKILQSLQP